MKRLWLSALLTLILAGCGAVMLQQAVSTEPPGGGANAAPVHAVPPVTPLLVAHESHALGLRLSIPAGAAVAEGPDRLTIEFGDARFEAIRQTMAEPMPLKQVAAEFAAANIRASQGRFFVAEQGVRTLAGRDAGYVKAYFDSAAGRWDREFYLLPVGLVEYRVSCGTIDGPPPVPWERVRPLCERMLGSVSLLEGE